MTAETSKVRAEIVARLSDEPGVPAVADLDEWGRHPTYPVILLGLTGRSIEEDGDYLATLHVWSRAGTSAEAQTIIERVKHALERESASSELKLIVWPEYSEVRVDEEHSAHHGLVRYRVSVNANPASDISA